MANNERLSKAKERLNAYYDAELAILSGQEYKMGSKSLKRADLAQIRESIRELEKAVDELKFKEKTGARRRAFRVTPRDL
ncbi:MAG: DUF6148 family protein [Vallitalea sp.]|jgi:hypothetical protein|nr:DUF6148 family protein [Vallitalea sp.]